MYIIIAGCGRVGSDLATLLSERGHDVIVIDKEVEAFEKLKEKFMGATIVGDCLDDGVLREAGIEKADWVIGVTDDDNKNIMFVQLAKDRFGIKKVIARVDDPSLASVYSVEVGIPTVCMPKLGISKIMELIGD